jgi:hypothetical protein
VTRSKRVSIADGRAALLSSTLEAQWQNHVLMQIALGGGHGFHIRVAHGTLEGVHSPNRPFPRGADHDDATGFPDILAVFPDRGLLVIPELKRPGGQLGPGQDRWHGWLSDIVQVESPIWRTEDEAEVSRILLGR